MSPRARGLTRGAWVRVALVASIILLLGGRWLAIHHVERVWAGSLGVLETHAAIARLRLGLFGLALAAAAVWCVGNLLLIYRSIGSVQVPRRLGNLEFVEAVPRRLLLWGTVGLGLATALLLSYGARDWWDEFALLGASPAPSLADPLLQRDIGYYLFALPWQRVLQRFFLVLTGVGALLTVLLYGAVGALQWSGRRLVVSEVARAHVAGVLTAFAVALWFGFRLDPAEYVAGLHSVPYDAVLVGVRIPVARALAMLTMLVAVASLAWIWIDRVALVTVPWIALVLGTFTGRFVVPGFAAAMRPADQRAIPDIAAEQRRMLGMAYALAPRDTIVAPPVVPDPFVLTARARDVAAAPVWDDFVLVDLLNRVAGRRPQDRFEQATLGLYRSPSGPAVPLFVAAREVDLARAHQGERDLSWDDVHRGPYAHAVGAVAVQANAASPHGLPLFVSEVQDPAVAGAAVSELALEDSLIRFGPAAGPFAVIADSGVMVAGMATSGWLQRLALAWVLQSPRLLRGSAVPPASRILWRRAVVERLDRYAPFARFGAPYAVVADGRLVWLAAGYVRARAFPLSILASWRGEPVRYLRAGFVGVVDAHSGDTAVFLLDPDDPIAAAWTRLAPDVVRPGARMPTEIRRHVRYPIELFQLQVALLLRDTTSGLPVLPARRIPVPGRSAAATGVARPAAPSWVIVAFPGDSVPLVRLRAAVERGNPPLLAMVVDGAVRDGRASLERIRLAPPLVHAAPVEVGAAVPVDGGSFAGPAKPLLFPDALVTLQSVYAVAETAEAVPRLTEVTVGLGPVTGRGRSLADALGAVQLALRSPASRGAQWAELRDWFDRMEAARAAGDWALFGRAYDQLRRMLGVPRDTSP